MSQRGGKSEAVLAFVPVVHAGYEAFFRSRPGDAFVLGRSLIGDVRRLERDLRALDPARAATALSSVLGGRAVSVLEQEGIPEFSARYGLVVMPDEDVSEEVAARMLGVTVEFQASFLRWDKKITDKEFEIPPGRSITEDELHREAMSLARGEAEKSPDWWRQIGAALFRDGTCLATAHNAHLPHARTQDVLGDPRLNFDAGERPDTYLSLHAEIGVLAEAARKGVSTEGADIYVTTFPCSNCARALARSGIKRLFYRSGYSRLDAEPVLSSAGVEIVLVR